MNDHSLLYIPQVGLAICLALACWRDLAKRRIPNNLVLSGTLLALLLQATMTRGAGFFADMPGAIGILAALGGCSVGMLLLLPMYALRAMGAGDVKLMGLVGAFLGPAATLDAVVMTLLAGGLLSIGVAAWGGVLQAVIRNVRESVTQSVISVVWTKERPASLSTVSAMTLPYAFAITAGTVTTILLARAGHTLFA